MPEKYIRPVKNMQMWISTGKVHNRPNLRTKNDARKNLEKGNIYIMIFVDLEKAYYPVQRDKWWALRMKNAGE